MNLYRSSLCVLSIASAPLFANVASAGRPFVTIDVKSYETLLANVSDISAAVGEDASQMDAQIQAMVGPQVMALVDAAEPWHAAVWMESLDQSPVVALVLPIADYESFQTAVQSSMLGMMGALHMEVGDSVVLYGSNPGVILPDSWTASIEKYAAELKVEPTETVELVLNMNDSVRETATAGIEMMRAQMDLAYEDPELVEASGVPAETMQGFLDGYLTFYKNLIEDTDSFHLSFRLGEERVHSSVGIQPLPDTGTAHFLASQNVNIEDLAGWPIWDADIAFVAGMGDVPEDWQPELESIMEGLMPLYGLEAAAAHEWVEVTNETLPLKGVYTMDFEEGMSFSGFYEILDAPAAELYEKWIKITQDMEVGGEGALGYYSDIQIERAHREIDGVSVDWLVLTVNPEHPSMQPEMMEMLTVDGKITYEMALKGNRIFMATEGDLNSLMSSEPTSESPIEINANTRLAGTANFVSLMQMGAQMAPDPDMPDFSQMDAEGAEVSYAIEVSDRLVMKSALPLKLLKVFSELDDSVEVAP